MTDPITQFFLNSTPKKYPHFTLHHSIIVEATRACHKYKKNDNNEMGCTHCFLTAEDQQHMPEKLYNRIVEFVPSKFRTLSIAGGEPFLLPDRILSTARKCPNTLINIFTTGDLINREIASDLASFSNIALTISLHGDKSDHEFLMGEGSYARLLNSIAIINEFNIPWIKKTVVSQNNFDHIIDQNIFMDQKKLGYSKIDMCRYYAVGPLANPKLMLTPNQVKLLSKMLVSITKQGLGLFPERPGHACKSLPSIDIFGYVRPCPYMKDNTTQILENDNNKQIEDKLYNVKNNWLAQNMQSHYCTFYEFINHGGLNNE